MTEKPNSRPFAFADAKRGTRHVFVRSLEVLATVGVHEHEKKAPQRLIISVDLNVVEDSESHQDKLSNVVCYENVVGHIKMICTAQHVNLIETLAEQIAENCLQDRRILAVRVCIEKPDIISECASVGVEIERLQTLN
ncbi:MAG: dihydroneopterin aldolase [Pseudomonadota bacterium]